MAAERDLPVRISPPRSIPARFHAQPPSAASPTPVQCFEKWAFSHLLSHHLFPSSLQVSTKVRIFVCLRSQFLSISRDTSHLSHTLEFSVVCVVIVQNELCEKQKHVSGNLYLLAKRPDEGLLAGLWEFPSVLVAKKQTDVKSRRTEMNNYLKNLNFDLGKDYDLKIREELASTSTLFLTFGFRCMLSS